MSNGVFGAVRAGGGSSGSVIPVWPTVTGARSDIMAIPAGTTLTAGKIAAYVNLITTLPGNGFTQLNGGASGRSSVLTEDSGATYLGVDPGSPVAYRVNGGILFPAFNGGTNTFDCTFAGYASQAVTSFPTGTAALRYQNPGIFGSGFDDRIHITQDFGGISATIWDGAYQTTGAVPVPALTRFCARIWMTGTELNIQVNGLRGATAYVTGGTGWSTNAGVVGIGLGYVAAANYWSGSLFRFTWDNVVNSAADIASKSAWYRYYWGPSFDNI